MERAGGSLRLLAAYVRRRFRREFPRTPTPDAGKLRLSSSMRLLLATTPLVVTGVHPPEAGGSVAGTYAVLAVYVAHAAAFHVMAVRRGTLPMAHEYALPWVDVGVCTVLIGLNGSHKRVAGGMFDMAGISTTKAGRTRLARREDSATAATEPRVVSHFAPVNHARAWTHLSSSAVEHDVRHGTTRPVFVVERCIEHRRIKLPRTCHSSLTHKRPVSPDCHGKQSRFRWRWCDSPHCHSR